MFVFLLNLKAVSRCVISRSLCLTTTDLSSISGCVYIGKVLVNNGRLNKETEHNLGAFDRAHQQMTILFILLDSFHRSAFFQSLIWLGGKIERNFWGGRRGRSWCGIGSSQGHKLVGILQLGANIQNRRSFGDSRGKRSIFRHNFESARQTLKVDRTLIDRLRVETRRD